MKLIALLLVGVAVCYAEEAGVSQEIAKKYLETYGYYNPYVFGSTVESSLKQFQEFTGLPVTGVLDDATKAQMSKKRCGRPDRDGMNAFRDTRWRRTSLTYRFLQYSPDLSQSAQRAAIVKGMNLWTQVTPLKFSETSGRSDITIGFYRRSHGDNSPFDGSGKVLAHAYFPENGRLHFDEDETWTTGSSRGTNLDWVATHEFGHTLGLEHSNIRGTVMYPYYQGYKPNLALQSDDIRRIQAQYGRGGTGGGGNTCADKDRRCGGWKSYCRSNKYVQANCKKTCGTC